MTALEKAQETFFSVCNLDGYGIVVTDMDLLAETIAEAHDVSPKEIYPDYEGNDDESDPGSRDAQD